MAPDTRPLQSATGATGPNAPAEPALEGILRRIAEIRENVSGLRGVADRVCGALPPEDAKIGCSPNGLLDTIEHELDVLRGETFVVLTRLRRLCSG